MTDYTNDIKRYLSGEMTPAEMHALEKKALSDPFLADALEGAAAVGAHHFTNEVNEINTNLAASNEALTSKLAFRPAVSATEKPVVQRVSVTNWAMRIAAGLILLVATTFAIWQFSKEPENESLALNEADTKNKETQATGDSPADTYNPIGKTETPPAADQTGKGLQDRTGPSGSSYPADAKAKTHDLLAEAKPEAEKAAEDQPGQLNTQPVLAEAPKIREQAEELPVTEKAAELAAIDKREEEGKLQKKDARADGDRNKAAGATRSSVQQNQTTIQGRVTSSEDGSPLAGVNVVIKGTSIGTVTDAGGNYQIESAQSNPLLEYSFIGHQSQEVAAGDRRQVDVKMPPDAAQLSEVVVTGYGIQNSTPYAPTVELAHPSIGNRAFKQYLESNVRYPVEALNKKIEGRVTVEFFVETNGALTNFTIIRGIGAGCDEELIRLIDEGPKWEPTKRDGAPIRDKARVRLKYELPKKP
jgi:TonB family protein